MVIETPLEQVSHDANVIIVTTQFECKPLKKYTTIITGGQDLKCRVNYASLAEKNIDQLWYIQRSQAIIFQLNTNKYSK